MGNKFRWNIITIIVLMLFIVGCSVSEEEALNETKAIFLTDFQSNPLEANQKANQVSFYLPKNFSITEVSEHNVVFNKGEQLFLLFYNPVEGSDSKVNMEHDLEFKEEALLFETVEEEGRFGYLMVVPDKDNKLQLIIGIGGRKITTLSSLSDLAESAQDMMQVVNSIEYN